MLLESGHGDDLVGITRGNIPATGRAIPPSILLKHPAFVNAAGSALRGKVFRFLSLNPFNVAAQTWLLRIRDWLFGEGGIQRISEVGASDRDAAFGATVIELSTIG